MTFVQNNNIHFKDIVTRSKECALNTLELLTEEGMEVSNGDEGMYMEINKFEEAFVMEVIKSMAWN